MTRTAAKPLTLGQLARRVGLARSSVLHYEALGLLAPAGRSGAGYRLYGEAELERLRTIRRLRESGLTLEDIGALLAPGGAGLRDGAGPVALLELRLLDLCQEVERLREQQRHLAHLLADPELRGTRRQWSKDAWVALLQRAGFDEAAMQLWHQEFERDSPAAHAAFLASLGLAPAEIDAIRQWSRLGDSRASNGGGAAVRSA